MIQNLIFGIFSFENIISVSGIHLFYIRPHLSVDINRMFCFFFFFFLNFLISQLKIWKPTKTRKKALSFYNKVLLKNLTHFMKFNSLEIENIMLCNTAKNLSHFTNFPANIFLFGVRKNFCTASFLDAQELYS